MTGKGYAIQRRDLSKYGAEDLERMVHFVHTLAKIIAPANITSDIEILADLEKAINDEIADITLVLGQVERRISNELARRAAA